MNAKYVNLYYSRFKYGKLILTHYNKFYPPISSQWGIFYLHRHMDILFMRDSLYASQGSPFTLNIALRIKQNFILCNQSQKTTI